MTTNGAPSAKRMLLIASQLPEASDQTKLATTSLAQFVRIAAQVAEGFDQDEHVDND